MCKQIRNLQSGAIKKMLYLLINYHVSVCSIMEFYSEKKSLKPLLISLQSQGYDFQAVHLQAHFYAMLVQIFTQKKKPHHSHKGDTNLDSKFFPSHRSFVSLFAYSLLQAFNCTYMLLRLSHSFLS